MTVSSVRLSALPRATWLLCAAQALNLTAAVIAVTIVGLVGTKLAANPALGTIPYGAQFAAVMVATYPASMLMQRFGRRVVFSVAAFFLILSGALGMYALESSSFAGLIGTHFLLGVYIACANFYRFAAVDHVDAVQRPKAISLVVAGGVLAAVIGPIVASAFRVVPGHAEFAWCYGSFMILGALTLILMLLWRPVPCRADEPAAPLLATATVNSAWNLPIWTAIFCSAGGYFLMNLLMVQASLVLNEICSFGQTSQAIQMHVLAMFVPSFFTGSVIARIGLKATLLLGFGLLIAAAIFGGMPIDYDNIFISLILLGLGWNFTYVGGGALLAQAVSDQSRHRWQGVNDTAIAACATLGAFLPAPLMATLGWNITNLAAIPLCILGMVLCVKTLNLQPTKTHAISE